LSVAKCVTDVTIFCRMKRSKITAMPNLYLVLSLIVISDDCCILGLEILYRDGPPTWADFKILKKHKRKKSFYIIYRRDTGWTTERPDFELQ
jgi:hypothetical protein